MKHLIAIGVAAGAALAATPHASAPAVTGRVVFTGPLPGNSGTVKFEGEKPETKPLVIEAAKSEGCVPGGAVDDTNETVLIGADGGLANVVVLVDVKGAVVKVPEEPVQLDQKGCHFLPHVTVVPMGTTVEFLNSDGISHNVHIYPAKNKGFNQIIAAGASAKQKFDLADRIEVKCDIHPWMNSWVIVAEEPYYAVTDANGCFALPALPPGTHDVEYWHETLGKNKGKIVVAEDGTAAPIEFAWGMEKKKPRR